MSKDKKNDKKAKPSAAKAKPVSVKATTAKPKAEVKKTEPAKRNIASEIKEGIKALADVREGKAKVHVKAVVKENGKPVAKIAHIVPKDAKAKKPKTIEIKSSKPPTKKHTVPPTAKPPVATTLSPHLDAHTTRLPKKKDDKPQEKPAAQKVRKGLLNQAKTVAGE